MYQNKNIPFINSARIVKIPKNDQTISPVQLPVKKVWKNIPLTEDPQPDIDIMENIKKQFLNTTTRNFVHQEYISPSSSQSTRAQSPQGLKLIVSPITTKKILLSQRPIHQVPNRDSENSEGLISPQLQVRKQSPIQTHRIITYKNIPTPGSDFLTPENKEYGNFFQIKKNKFVVRSQNQKNQKKNQATECSFDYKQTNNFELPSILNNHVSSEEDHDVSIILSTKPREKQNSIILANMINPEIRESGISSSELSETSEDGFFNVFGEEEYQIWGIQQTQQEQSSKHNENFDDSSHLREFFHLYKDRHNNYPNEQFNLTTDEGLIQIIALLTDVCQRRYRKLLIAANYNLVCQNTSPELNSHPLCLQKRFNIRKRQKFNKRI